MRLAGASYEEVVNGFHWAIPSRFNIADAIVTAQGGRLTLVSSPQQGTVATVALPLAAAPRAHEVPGDLVGSA